MEKVNYRKFSGEYVDIDISRLIDDFGDAYGKIYDARDDVPGIEFLMSFFNSHLPYAGDFQNVLTAFCKARQDFVSSDREAAAFVAALGKQLY